MRVRVGESESGSECESGSVRVDESESGCVRVGERVGECDSVRVGEWVCQKTNLVSCSFGITVLV